jgi:hypothetical protein
MPLVDESIVGEFIYELIKYDSNYQRPGRSRPQHPPYQRQYQPSCQAKEHVGRKISFLKQFFLACTPPRELQTIPKHC